VRDVIDPVVPNSNQPISSNGLVTPIWQRFFNALIPLAGAVAPVAAGSSPVTYQASQRGTMSISGGTLTSVTLTRAGVAVPFGTSRVIPMLNADTVTVSFSVAPTINFLPG
jgi:hypothetical protein